ncbi:MAG TPA: glycosyltransferase, partial [Acidimicrobiia bacterium]
MRVNVVTPWYPNRHSPYSGIFVEQTVAAVESFGATVEVEVPLIYPAPSGPIPPDVKYAMEQLAGTDPEALFEVVGNTTWIPAPVPSLSGPMGRARAFAEGLALKRRHLPTSSDITHAHLGMPTGWAVRQAGCDGPLVITEHQSTLADVFRDDKAREAYLETLRAADAFICVSGLLVDLLRTEFGDEFVADVEVVPNVVDTGRIGFSPRKPPEFKSWIYIGGLTEKKGVMKLLQCFWSYTRRFDSHATLTVIGDGPLRVWVEKYSDSKALSDSVDLVGAIPHSRINQYLQAADVLVHLSEFETFGISSLEAIAAGLPVVSLRNGGAESTWGDVEQSCGLILGRNEDPETIATKIAGLRSEPARLDPLVGRSMVASRFSPHSVGGTLMSIYER